MRISSCLPFCMFSCMNTDRGVTGGAVRDRKLIQFSTGLEGLCFCLAKSGTPQKSSIAKSQAYK